MKNLSIDLKLISFEFSNFSIYTFPDNKKLIINLVENFNKKSKQYIGRGNVYIYNNLVIRKFSHGGVLRHLFKDFFINKDRFIDELKLTYILFKNGFPTIKPVGILITKGLLPFFKGFLVTENLNDSVDIIKFLLNPNNENLNNIFFNMGTVTKKLHSFNIIHGDLHLKNFLIKSGEIFLIDFDKSFFSDKKDDKLHDIKRFVRSCFKLNYFYREKIKLSHIQLFLKGYGSNENIINQVKINWLNKLSWQLNKPKYLIT